MDVLLWCMLRKLKKILLIDDDETQLILAKAILKSNYTITSVKSGREALEHLYKGLTPDLILLDILMPNMDGWEVFNRIKAISNLHEVPIVFLTSMNMPADINRAHEMGAVDFITKPYDRADLVKRIKKAISIKEKNKKESSQKGL